VLPTLSLPTMTEISRLSTVLADKYRIESEIGAGGMATVYLAHDIKHNRKVALKVLRPELATALGPERFIREIEIAARLHHPHILPLYDSGQAGDLLYYVMPYVEGQSLRERVAQSGELPIAEAVRILREVVDALAKAHAQGVVHRDIKPENVMLSDRHALVTDFGVAKAVSEATGHQQLTTAGLALGTPAYMAPEQAAADPHVDHRADIYALGALAYELLTGRPPFTGSTPQAVLSSHVTRAPEPVTDHREAVPPALAQLVMRCLEKKPADRWQTAEELLQQLDAVVTPSGGLTPTGTLPVDTVSAPQRGRLIGAGFVFGAVAVAAVGWWLLTRDGTGGTATGDRTPIAVLVFENRGATEDGEYFSEGLADDINTQLSKIEGFAVKAHASARRLSRDSMSYAEIADELGADYLVHGNWSRSGDSVRIAVRLIDPVTEDQAWVDNYNRAFTASGMFAVQRDVAEQVATALNVAVGPSEQERLATEPTASTGAYNAYQLGRFYWNQRTEDGLRRAIQHFGEAIAQDSNYALAYSGLADAYAVLPSYGLESSPELIEQAKAAARKAISLGEESAEAHTSMAAVIWWYDWDWIGAEAEFERAIGLNPDYPTLRQWYGTFLVTVGRVDEGLAHLRQAAVLDPLSFVISRNLSYALLAAHRYEDAVAQSQKSLELGQNDMPDFYALVWSYLLAGMADEAFEYADSLGEFSMLAMVHAWRGDRETARSLLQQSGAANDPNLLLYQLGTLLILGDSLQVFEAFESALDTRSPLAAYVYVRIPPFDAALRTERFRSTPPRIDHGSGFGTSDELKVDSRVVRCGQRTLRWQSHLFGGLRDEWRADSADAKVPG
jgi:serine/threonine-protein kinase